MKQRVFLALLLIVLSTFGLVLNLGSSSNATTTDALADIQNSGRLRIGSDLTYPPFESINPGNNVPYGFDVDLAIIMAHELGVNITYIESAWDPIISNLKANKYDIILSAMTITSERAQEVDFTRWYYISAEAWLVPASNPKGITTEADLNQTGLKIGYQTGTIADLYVNETLHNAEGHGYSDVPTAIQALKNGNIDVVLGDWAVLAKAAQDDTTLAVPGTFSPEYFGIAVRKGETNLLNALNNILDNLLGTDVNNPSSSDLYNTIFYKWFNTDDLNYKGSVRDASLPTDVTINRGSLTSTSSSSSSQETSASTSIPTTTNTLPTTDGFTLFSIVLISVIPIITRYKKQKNS